MTQTTLNKPFCIPVSFLPGLGLSIIFAQGSQLGYLVLFHSSFAFPCSFLCMSWKSPSPFVISDSVHWFAFLLHFCKEGFKLYEFTAPQTWIHLLLSVITEIEKLLIYLHPPDGRAGSRFFFCMILCCVISLLFQAHRHGHWGTTRVSPLVKSTQSLYASASCEISVSDHLCCGPSPQILPVNFNYHCSAWILA